MRSWRIPMAFIKPHKFVRDVSGRIISESAPIVDIIYHNSGTYHAKQKEPNAAWKDHFPV